MARLSEAEVRLQLEGLNRTQRERPDRRVHELFEEQVRARPAEVAVVGRTEAWTYEELNRRANRVAHALLATGLDAEDVVAVGMERDLNWTAAVLGVFKAGGAYLPVEPGHPPDRIAVQLRQSGCRTVLTDGRSRDRMAAATAGVAAQTLTVDDAAGEPMLEHNPEIRVKADHLAYVYFTSGSTGQPKGAMCEHAGLVNHLLAKVEDLGLTDRDIVAQCAPQCFDISLWQLVTALVIGGRTAIIEQDAIVDVNRFLATLARHRATVLQVVPSYLDIMLVHLATRPRPLADLRVVCVTGEAVKKSLVQRWFAAFPHIVLVNAYGATETSDDVTHHVMSGVPAEPSVPVGRPIANLAIYVLDEDSALVPLGSPGEIVASGVGVGRGYINDPERTAHAFGADPFFPDRRIYRTGDRGRWLPGGVLEFLGRRDEQVKVAGMRLEIGEIEARILDHGLIRDVAVVVGEKAHGGKSLAAFFTAAEPVPTRSLREFLARTLPAYMIPTHLAQLDALPLTANGKVDKRALGRAASALGHPAPEER